MTKKTEPQSDNGSVEIDPKRSVRVEGSSPPVEMQRPSVGRIVMYIENPSAKPIPAIVQAVDDEGNVTRLVVIHNGHFEFVSDVPTKGEPTGRHWHWPTKV